MLSEVIIHFSLQPLSMKVVSLTVQRELAARLLLPTLYAISASKERARQQPLPSLCCLQGKEWRETGNVHSNNFQNQASCKCPVDGHTHADLTTLCIVHSMCDSPGITKGWRSTPLFPSSKFTPGVSALFFSFFCLTKEICTWVVLYMYRTPQSINKKQQCR